jgi:hypothetical protein
MLLPLAPGGRCDEVADAAMFEDGVIERAGVDGQDDPGLQKPLALERIGGVVFEDIHAEVPLRFHPRGGEVGIPFSVEEMELGSPDMFAHRALVVFAPDDLGLGGGEPAEGAGATQLDAVVFGDRCGEIIPAVGVQVDVRIGAVQRDGVGPRQGIVRRLVRRAGGRGGREEECAGDKQEYGA